MNRTSKKPKFISHYLVLRDLIHGVDPRKYNDTTHYLTSRVENIKCDLIKKYGLEFDESAKAYGKYAPYKPYVLIKTDQNIKKAKAALMSILNKDIKAFLGIEDEVQES